MPLLALNGPSGDRVANAVYPSLAVDRAGHPLDGNNNYILYFDKGKLPPVDAFWSVTAYDVECYLIPNVMKRQALGDRDKLVTNADGSADFYLQADSPGAGKEANWLPVAKGAVHLADAPLLAERRNPRRLVDTATGTAGKLSKSAFGTFRTFQLHRRMSAVGGKADMTRTGRYVC
jgi:hypothetical protein